MDIAIKVPPNVAAQLRAQWNDLPRRALEALAVEAYRSGVLTAAEVQQMLQLPSRWATDSFLQQRRAYLDYDEDDILHDIKAIRQAKR